MNFAIVLAAGTGSRFGKAVLKQRAPLAGKAVYEHTLERLQAIDSLGGIVVVTNQNLISERAAIKRKYPKVLDVIQGGSTRLESSFAGLRYFAPIAEFNSKVIIHDAVRPFVDEDLVARILAALEENDAVDPVIDSTDTLVLERDGYIDKIPERHHLKRGQTPQGFNFRAILDAFERAFASGKDLNFSDDCGLFLQFGDGDPRVRLVPGSEDNIKVTVPIDLTIAEAIVRKNQMANFPRRGSLRDKVVLLIGADGTLGVTIAKHLRQVGMRVASLSGPDAIDVRDARSLYCGLRAARGIFGPIDVVVNLAAELHAGDLMEQAEADLTAMVETNLLGSIWLARATFPLLSETSGQLLLLSSSSAPVARRNQVVYAATKAAVSNLAQGLAREWAAAGVRVNCLEPSRMATSSRGADFANGDEREDLIPPEQVAINVEMILSANATGMTFLGRTVGGIC